MQRKQLIEQDSLSSIFHHNYSNFNFTNSSRYIKLRFLFARIKLTDTQISLQSMLLINIIRLLNMNTISNVIIVAVQLLCNCFCHDKNNSNNKIVLKLLKMNIRYLFDMCLTF
jgi:hypothetical protein